MAGGEEGKTKSQKISPRPKQNNPHPLKKIWLSFCGDCVYYGVLSPTYV